jgi:amino acid transporter
MKSMSDMPGPATPEPHATASDLKEGIAANSPLENGEADEAQPPPRRRASDFADNGEKNHHAAPLLPDMPPEVPGVGVDVNAAPEEPNLSGRIKTLLIGKPRDLADKSIFHSVSLVAFLAWVGLGADGLSSSCYGPPEAFASLGEHRYLGIFLALAITATVFVIASCYSHIIEEFPSGGGGYLVASKLLGDRAGVVSGCALLVDYVMTITVSIAAAGDALFGLLGPEWSHLKLSAEVATIIFLMIVNLRGVKESIQMLLPIFLLFLLTHAILIAGALTLHLPAAAEVAQGITDQVGQGLNNPQLGLWGMLALLLRAYSLGAGTYTGLEAVSNSMPVMREPRVATAAACGVA